MSVSLPSNFSITYKKIGGGTPVAHTAIPGVTDFDPGQRAADDVDATDYDSPDDSEETETGVIRSSPGTLVMNYEPGNAVHEDFLASIGKKIELIATNVTRTETMTVNIKGAAAPVGVPGTLRKLTVSIKLTGTIERDDVA